MKKMFGSYGWTLLAGIVAGFARVKGVDAALVPLLLVALATALYAEYRSERGGARKVVGIVLALILSPVLFSVAMKMVMKLMIMP